MLEVHQGSFTISTDPARLQLEVIVVALAESCWVIRTGRTNAPAM